MHRVKHPLWCVLTTGGRILATARSVMGTGARHLPSPDPPAADELPPAPTPSLRCATNNESRSRGEQVLAGNHKKAVITAVGFTLQPATLVTLTREGLVAPSAHCLV